jgi:hypothetical protein
MPGALIFQLPGHDYEVHRSNFSQFPMIPIATGSSLVTAIDSDPCLVSLDERAKDEEKPFLEQLLQEGARKLLQAAIENEVIDYIQFHKDRRDENGRRLVVSGVGPIRVRQPRVRHRDKGRFSSAILPPPPSNRPLTSDLSIPILLTRPRWQNSL